MNKTGSKSFRLWGTMNPQSIPKHTSHKIILDIISHRRLIQAVETAKRILIKEKLDKQLTGQASTSPFMSFRDGINRKVSFNTRDELGDKIDK